MRPTIDSYEDVREAVDSLLAGPARSESPAPAPSAARCDPEVTVSMPARNAEEFVGTAIRSVLLQEGISVRLVVVDDASSDATGRIARSFRDPRVTVLENHRQRGIGYCHNRVLAVSDTPFVVHVDADDFVLPRAMTTMVSAIRGRPEVGQAHSDFLLVGPDGHISESEYRRQREFLVSHRRENSDYRRGLLVDGMVTNTLRTYRASVFDEIGRFHEDLPYAVDYEMSVRIADAYDIVRVPEVLYVQRRHRRNTQQNLSFRDLRSWWTRARICLRLMSDRGWRLLGYGPLRVFSHLAVGLARVLRVEAGLKWLMGRR